MKQLFHATLILGFLTCGTAAKADIYEEAVANEARGEKDREIDERRKPAEIMRFFEIKPDMKVLDVFAGGGYYSELISYVVGENGEVTLYNNAPWDKFVGKAVSERLAGERLPNVERLIATPESLIDLDRQYDAAIFVLGMHDVYYAHPEDGWPEIDKQKFLKGIHHLLKDGAVFGVIDANAVSGANNAEVGKSLHRVDPKAMIDDIVAAGFKLEAQSEVLRNPDDDKVSSVFTPENRYRTDRSVVKFRK